MRARTKTGMIWGLGVFVLLMVVVVGASILAPGFFTYTNLTNTLITASITAVTGLGMTFAIAMGGFDLSVGSIQVLTAIVAAGLLSIVDPALAILGALLTGLAIGLLNGILISKLRLPAFVVTFGMMSVVRGVALLVTQGQSVMITKHIEFGLLNNGKIFGLPVPFLIMIACVHSPQPFARAHAIWTPYLCHRRKSERCGRFRYQYRPRYNIGVWTGGCNRSNFRSDARLPADDSGRHPWSWV
jgi:ribose/xylose/arabinose/galactoside ABC-type transport system permease subunit